MLVAGVGDAAPAAEADPLPSAELLLYLSEFEDTNGDFVDPMALQEESSRPVWTHHDPEERESDDAAPAAQPTRDDDRDEAQRPR